MHARAESVGVVGKVGRRTAELFAGRQQVPEDFAHSQNLESRPAS